MWCTRTRFVDVIRRSPSGAASSVRRRTVAKAGDDPSLLMLGPEVVSRMRRVEDHYRELSRELTLEEWLQRAPRTRYVDNIMRLTAALQ